MPAATDGVDFVDENDAGTLCPRGLEQVSDALSPDSNIPIEVKRAKANTTDKTFRQQVMLDQSLIEWT
jgi:hypothetical protein